MRRREFFGVCNLRGKWVRSGRGGNRRVIFMRLGGGSSTIVANDGVRHPPEAVTESDGRQRIHNRARGGVQPVEDYEWGKGKPSQASKGAEDEKEEQERENYVEDFLVSQR